MNDEGLLDRIGKLVAEEHELEGSRHEGGLDGTAVARLGEIEIALDQCWDLLRQRRARRSSGADPDGAFVRPPSTVEGYQQ